MRPPVDPLCITAGSAECSCFLNCLFCRRAIAEGLASCYRQQRSNDWRVCGTTERRLRHTYDEEALNNFARLSMSAGSVLLLQYDPPEDDGQGCGAVNACHTLSSQAQKLSFNENSITRGRTQRENSGAQTQAVAAWLPIRSWAGRRRAIDRSASPVQHSAQRVPRSVKIREIHHVKE